MVTTDEPADGAGEAGPAKTAAAKKKKKLMIAGGAGAAVLLLAGGGSYMAFGRTAESPKAAAAAKQKAAEEKDAAEDAEASGEGEHGKAKNEPLDVPPLLVNLHTPDGAPHFLKVHVMLVPGPKSNMEELKKDLPVLLDAYQPFLRELRPEDLSGSAAVFRIKEELLIRAGSAIGQDKVKDVLVQDLIQQ